MQTVKAKWVYSVDSMGGGKEMMDLNHQASR